MDITPYVDSLRRDLLAVAEAAGPETQAAAERLTYALDPAVRLALMEAVAQAAAEITAEMATGGVDVRLDGRELAFVVDSPLPTAAVPPAAPPSAEDDSEGGVARITLRLPEAVKTRAEELAARSGHSLNTWLVNIARAATRSESAVTVDLDLSSLPFSGSSRRMTGWI